jgi:hypothetical protein
MPTLQSEYYAGQANELVRFRANANIACGEVRLATFEYKFGWKPGVVEAVGDIVQLGRLDPNVMVLSDEIKVISEGVGGTGVTLTKVGDQQDDDRYSAAALALTAAGWVPAVPPPTSTIPDVVITKDVNDIVQATLGGTLPATVGKRFWVRIKYRPN